MLAEVRARLKSAAEVLRERYGARQLLLFGSFARGTPTSRSDVDVAVEGIAAQDQFRSMAFLTGALGRPVDLLRLEDLRPEDRERIFEDAEVI